MRRFGVLSIMFVIITSTVAVSHSAGPPDEVIRSAYKQLLAEADANKDGKLSVSECKALFTDPAKADKNCRFWDADNDGIITEDEYVQQVKGIGKKR